MFNTETEKKIVEYIKKSPLGVTSAEVAGYVGLNRMTIGKYLSIIREKALIDFKQFGMAKLWYIPVNVNKDAFLSKILADIIPNIPIESQKKLFSQIGTKLGDDVSAMYLRFYDVQKLSCEQVCESYGDLVKKLGGACKVSRISDKAITIGIVKDPFPEIESAVSRAILSALFAQVATVNLGFGNATIQQAENESSRIIIHVTKDQSNLTQF